MHGRKFREVYRGARVRTIFVTVPGIGTAPLQNWSNGDGGIWLTSIPPTSTPDIAVYCFDHETRADDEFSWNILFDQGAELLDELIKLGEHGELPNCPMFLIAHSLGGIIVKEAMSLIHQQATEFRQLRRTIAGAIFLGTPHSRSEDPKSWQNAGAILRLHSRSKSSKLPITHEIAKRLAGVSLSFEQAFDLIPVLSVFETRETRVGSFLSAKTILVGQEFARTTVRFEILVGVDADHNKICSIKSGSQALNEISSFLESAMNDAQGRIRKGSDEYVTPVALDQQTARAMSVAESLHQFEDITLTPHATNAGTAGSSSMGFDIIPLVSDFSVERSDPLLPCHMMPPHARNRSFFGRTEVLKSIRIALWPKSHDNADSESEETTLRTFALCGPGGIGKTQVATEFVHTSKDKYDAIFWLQADERSKLSQGYSNIAVKLGLVLEDSADARDPLVAQDLVKAWLANPLKTYKQLEAEKHEEAKWLLIFDNVDDPDILDDFWPLDYAGAGAVLITSRDPLAKTYIYSEESGVTLPPFTTEEATDFLLKLTRREGDEVERVSGSSVAKRLGGLPLAITQMAGVIDRRELSFSEFLNVFEEEDTRDSLFKMQVGSTKTRSGYQHTLDTVWALEKLGASSATLLDVLSLLDPDGVPETILESKAQNIESCDYPQTNAAYHEARTVLLQSSLIARDRVARRITIHRLVQDGARSKMTSQRFSLMFSLAVNLLSAVWPFEAFSFGHGVSRWAQCAELFPHAFLSPVFNFPNCWVMPAGEFNHQRGNSLESTAYFESAKSICQNLEEQLLNQPKADGATILSSVRTLLAEISHDLGCIATETNQPEAALFHFQRFNSMMIETADGKPQKEDMRLAVSWNELGNAHMMNESWVEAEKCFILSIKALEQLKNYTRLLSSFPVINLGFSYWLQGRLEEANKTLFDILAIRIAELGINDRESFMTGKLLHACGNVKASEGQLDESFNLHQRALQHYRSTIGNNHHRTGDLCVKVSDHYVRFRQYSPAMSLLDQALKIYGDREYYGPEKARALYKKGTLVKISNNAGTDSVRFLDEALKLYRKARVGDFRPIEELSDADFDRIIVFWSK